MEVKKLIRMSKELAVTVQTFATLEKRSFNSQVLILLDEATKNRTVK